MDRKQRQDARLGNTLPDDLPQVLSVEGTHGPMVHDVNRAALKAGIMPGARVTDMRALCPSVHVDYADPAGDQAAMDRLALWAQRWCPWTVADRTAGGNGLILDTTGSDHLWGGEAAMLQEIEASLSVLGFSVRLALAPTWGAAWALARFGPVRAIMRGDHDLAPLQVAALRLGEDTVLLLNRLGLKTIGVLTAVPRLSLARRFTRADLADNPLLRLDQLSGHLPEPVSPASPPPVFRADARLAEPIFDPTHHLPGLCEALCIQLAKTNQGARRLRLTVYRTDGEISRIGAATSLPSRDAAHLAFLFRERLERIDPGFGFDLITLDAPVTEALGVIQSGLETGIDAPLELSHLVDRLTARFGGNALAELRPVASHIPERAEARAAPQPKPAEPQSDMAERPQRLLDPAEEVRVLYPLPEGPPAQFQWRRRTHRVARYQGPERIAPEWWHDKPGARLRDYFKVEDSTGHRFWLYREGLTGDGRGDAPRWFLHGIFA